LKAPAQKENLGGNLLYINVTFSLLLLYSFCDVQASSIESTEHHSFPVGGFHCHQIEVATRCEFGSFCYDRACETFPVRPTPHHLSGTVARPSELAHTEGEIGLDPFTLAIRGKGR
jgi:hypothetical protein